MGEKPKIYIDGKEGTTGLQIYERLGDRQDIQLLLIDEDKRKDAQERRRFLNEADLVFLCLPDAAAVEAVSLIENGRTRVIDASTAHRTAPGWVYGFAEVLPGQRDKIRAAARVANPGCHATGFLAAAAPLIHMGMVPRDYPMTCFSLTGYSGGGKKMIAEYQDPQRSPLLDAPSPYALGMSHKHLPEMQAVAGLERPPAFTPILGDIYQGMATSIQLHSHLLKGRPDARAVWELLDGYYQGQALVKVRPFGAEPARISASAMAGLDTLELVVTGSGDQVLVTALFDNLGKGASGAAVQNMDLMLGMEETAGLSLGAQG